MFYWLKRCLPPPSRLSRLPPGCSDIVCAHFYAVELYAESVRLGNEQSFIANKCSNLYSIPRSCTLGKAVMGYAAHNTTRGIHYMKTNGTSQYTPYGNKKIHRSKWTNYETDCLLFLLNIFRSNFDESYTIFFINRVQKDCRVAILQLENRLWELLTFFAMFFRGVKW